MEKVKIIGDSGCDISRELLERFDITLAPLYVTLGDMSYRDGVDITAQGVLDYCASHRDTPKTAATSVGDFMELFAPYVAAGRPILFISISGHLSAQIQNARLAAREFPEGAVTCVDSQNVSMGTGLLVLEAAEMAMAGMGAEEIAKAIAALTGKVRVSLVLDTLLFVRRGGRCSSLTLLGSEVLRIKPELIVSGGRIIPGQKFRGNILRVAEKYVAAQLERAAQYVQKRMVIAYSTWPKEGLNALHKMVESLGYFEEILTIRAGSVITSHAGPGAMGLIFMEK